MPVAQRLLKLKSCPFGVLEFLHWDHDWNNHKYSSKEELRKAILSMRQAGACFIRMDFVWGDIEPRQGDFKFDRYDDIVGLLLKNGVQILGILDYAADWASPCGRWNYPSADTRAFVDYAVKAARHYGNDIKYWEVWNEPDSSIYWNPQDHLKGYCALLRDTYTALKKTDPGIKVLNGGLANGLASVSMLYENGAGGYFDILNLHIFDSPFIAGSAKRVASYPRSARNIMQRNGEGDKPIWITEIGVPGISARQKVKNWWMGKNPGERQQAAWLKAVFQELLKSPDAEKFFWAFLRDTGEFWGDGTDYLGLVRWDFSRKPAFFAYKACVDKWKSSQAQ